MEVMYFENRKIQFNGKTYKPAYTGMDISGPFMESDIETMINIGSLLEVRK